MPSPTKDSSHPSLPPPSTHAHNPLLPPTELIHAPPSPRTHRALRRLQSAHSLGAKASSQQQLLQAQHQQRVGSPGLPHLPPPLPPPQLQLHATLQTQQQPPPSLISQQRLLQRDQNQHQHAVPQARNPSPIRREISSGTPGHHHGHMTSTPGIIQYRQQQQPQTQQPPGQLHLMAPGRSPQRGRANSEAQSVQHHVNMSAAKRAAAQGRRSIAADGMSLERLLRDGPPDGDVAGALESTRLKILDGGIKSNGDGMSNLRIYVWLILLSAPILSTNDYLALIHRGASPAYSKIRNDTFRTLTTDPLFRRRVSEASLIRLLNAVAWRLHDVREESKETTTSSRPTTRAGLHHNHGRPSLPLDLAAGPAVPMYQHPNGQAIPASSPTSSPTATRTSSSNATTRASRARALTLTTEGSGESSSLATAAEPGTYVQGMNVLAAPFLYAARSEAEAFVAFYQLLTVECPGYIRGAMDGVHKGLALVDKVLAIVDPKLSMYLTTKNMSAEIYAFPSVLTLCACTPPLPEVLRLWDFLFAYGPHLNILCIVAQLELIRNQILSNPSPNKLLRSFPALQADQIKATALTIIKRIPDDVYAEIVAHAK